MCIKCIEYDNINEKCIICEKIEYNRRNDSKMINIDIINNINGECIVEICKLHNYNCNRCNIEDNYNTCIECKENTIIEYINYNNINNI